MTVVIPPQSIASAREAFAGLLTDRCTISRSSGSRSPSGATVKATPAEIATDVPCRVEFIAQIPKEAPSSAELERSQVGTHNLFFPVGTDLAIGDDVAVNGGTFTITALGDEQSDPFVIQTIAKDRG